MKCRAVVLIVVVMVVGFCSPGISQEPINQAGKVFSQAIKPTSLQVMAPLQVETTTVAQEMQVTVKIPITFRQTVFESGADFSGVRFNRMADFPRATFAGKAVFRGTTFLESADFRDAKLPEILDFRSVMVSGKPLDLTVARAPENAKCKIDLTNADIEDIRIDMDKFELCFLSEAVPVQPTEVQKTQGETAGPRAVKKRIRPEAISFETKAGVYEKVLQMLKASGRSDSYRRLDIEFRKLKYQEKANTSSPPVGFLWMVWDLFQRYWWNYAYAPGGVFWWTLGLYIVFCLVNMGIGKKLVKEVYSQKFTEYEEDRRPSILEILTYTWAVFFHVAMKIDNFKPGAGKKHPLLFTYILLVYLIGVVCVGFIAKIVVS